MQYKRKLKNWNCTKRRKRKNSKALKCGSTFLAQRLVTRYNSFWLKYAIGSTTSHEGTVIISFPSEYWEAAWPYLTYSLTGRRPYSFPLFHLPFLYASLSFPSCLAKFILNSLPSFRGRKYSRAIPACLAYKFCRLQTQLTRSRFFTK